MEHPGKTGISIRPINLDDYHRSVSKSVYYVNDFDITNVDDAQKLNRLLYTKYDGEVLNVEPTCECGHCTGEELVDTGYKCEICGFEVTHVTERPIESVLWMAVPDGIEAFITTSAWRKLSKMLHIPSFKTLQWLCDPSYKPKGTLNSKAELFISHKFPRGINNFYRNFDKIIDVLTESKPSILPLDRSTMLRAWVNRYRGQIFAKQLPVPSNLVFPVEKAAGTSTMYADEKMGLMLEAVRCINSISHRGNSISDRVKNKRVVDCIDLAARFYKEYYSLNHGKKGGMFRKGLLGSRLDFTARAVASSIHGVQSYDEVHLPWGVACELYRLHITSMLVKAPYYMTPNEATELINRHIRTYNPILSEIFDQIIGDGHQTYIILQRNPTLTRLAGMCLRVTKIRKDPSINTIGVPVLITAFMNADFDGDELNIILLTDRYLIDAARDLSPHKGVFDLNTPFKIASDLSFPAPLVSTIANWMHNRKRR